MSGNLKEVSIRKKLIQWPIKKKRGRKHLLITIGGKTSNIAGMTFIESEDMNIDYGDFNTKSHNASLNCNFEWNTPEQKKIREILEKIHDLVVELDTVYK